MTFEIRLELRAQAEIEAAREWWLANRRAAPAAFDEELEKGFDLIRSMPGAGQPVENARRVGVRRVLLGRTRYHLYYVPGERYVVVLALWHSARGQGPKSVTWP